MCPWVPSAALLGEQHGAGPRPMLPLLVSVGKQRERGDEEGAAALLLSSSRVLCGRQLLLSHFGHPDVRGVPSPRASLLPLVLPEAR